MSGRLLRLLADPGAVLDREDDAWIVRMGPDRRRKPVMRLSEAQMLSQLDGRALAARPGGGWRLLTAQEAPAPVPVFRRAARETPMAQLLRTGVIGKRHVAALEAFNRDQTAGYAERGLTSNWDAFAAPGGGRRGSGDDAATWRLKARERVRRAQEALGPLRGLFEAVCLNEVAVGAAERELRIPKGEGKLRVRDALERLADFYGV
ncbi:MAG: DUF6456 domain-containing protein [Asticcacaulis sp.]